jgi:predicted nucleic acid-binding protein
VTIADTSVWVEFLRNREPVHSRLKTLLEKGEVLGAECVFGELLAGARTGRETSILEAYWASLPKVDQTGIWIEAGKLGAFRRLHTRGVGLVDAVILTHALRTGAEIWTLDQKLADAARR